MAVDEILTAFGPDNPVPYYPIRSNYWKIRELMRDVSCNWISQAEAASLAKRAKHPPILIDDDHAPGDEDLQHIPAALLANFILTRDIRKTHELFAAHCLSGKDVELLHMPQDWQDAWQLMKQAIAFGTLSPVFLKVEGTESDETIPIGNRVIIDKHGDVRLSYVKPGHSEEIEYTIRIMRMDYRELWPVRRKSKEQANLTSGAETIAVRQLVAIMQKSLQEPIPKHELRKRPEFAHVGQNAFERAFQAAALQTGAAAWVKPGRRPARAKGTPLSSANQPT